MKNFKEKISKSDSLIARGNNFGRRLLLFFLPLIVSGIFIAHHNVSAHQVTAAAITPFHVGERLTYNISFENFHNAAFAEIYAVSRGKLGDKDAVELRGKIKTNDLVRAAFYLLDETRTTFASAETGLPLYIRKTSNASVLPKETIYNYTVVPTVNYDLLTLIYKARASGGVGNFTMQEDDKIYNVSLQNVPAGKSKNNDAKIKTDFGEFQTAVSSVESEYLTEKGITNLKINFSSDEAKVPVLIQFKTVKGNFRAEIASVQLFEQETAVEAPPAPIEILKPQPTPKPVATPTPYIENQPLLPELPFVLGETLDYRVSSSNQFLGLVTLQAKERKLFSGADSLLLTAKVTETQPNQQSLNLDDEIRAQVNPESLAPQRIKLQFAGALRQFNTTAVFDQKTGSAIYNNTNRVEVPVGTHSLLSLIYAIRAFNLKPSKDLQNPVNDTRVAVFLDTKAYVFTLRPSTADIITLQGEKISAQQISISTGNPAIDVLNLRLWLSNDEKRLPLRLAAGQYQADLISEKIVQPK